MSYYGKLNERKIREEDYEMSCERARSQLNDYINQEAKRVNVDSAKKRAVLQQMDYEGFRQMVLGANIFPTKSEELYNFSKGKDSEQNVNKYFDESKEKQKEQNVKKSIEEKIIQKQVQGKSEYHCFSFRDFKKKFLAHYAKQLSQERVSECYKLIKQQNTQRLRRIFNEECEANILAKIVDIFSFIVKFMKEKESPDLENEMNFMIKYFQFVLNLPAMKEMGLMILTKKQKLKIIEFLDTSKIFLQETTHEQIDKVIAVVKK